MTWVIWLVRKQVNIPETKEQIALVHVEDKTNQVTRPYTKITRHVMVRVNGELVHDNAARHSSFEIMVRNELNEGRTGGDNLVMWKRKARPASCRIWQPEKRTSGVVGSSKGSRTAKITATYMAVFESDEKGEPSVLPLVDHREGASLLRHSRYGNDQNPRCIVFGKAVGVFGPQPLGYRMLSILNARRTRPAAHSVGLTPQVKKMNKIEKGKEKRGVRGGEKVVGREEAPVGRRAERKETVPEKHSEPRKNSKESERALGRLRWVAGTRRGRKKKSRAKNGWEIAPTYTRKMRQESARIHDDVDVRRHNCEPRDETRKSDRGKGQCSWRKRDVQTETRTKRTKKTKKNSEVRDEEESAPRELETSDLRRSPVQSS
ncbi:hypothetical protein K438DRAFT_1786398 [Mycena galopus ATCC 62051]|nr:hypothetical protein K438DRAFT_1786398 [Mycena galopus ATCC 62051]